MSKYKILLLYILFFSVFAFPQIAKAADYYVATTGVDTNPGTQTQPWKTIQKAASTMIAGDTAHLRGGTYNERVIINQHSGTANAFISFQAYQNEIPIIDGTGILFGGMSGLVEIRNIGYIRLKGLTINNSDNAGIFATNASNLEILDNNTNYTHSSGVGVWNSDHVLVSRNKVVNARYVDMPHGHEESISIATTTNFEVSYNDVSLNGVTAYLGNEGIDCKAGARFGSVHNNYIHNYSLEGGAIYIDAWDTLTGNIDIYSNYLNTTANGITINSERGGTVENIRIYNNLMYNTGAGGIAVSYKPGYAGLRRNIEIDNNTIYKARWNGGAGIYIIEPNIENIIIRNNIVYFNLYNGEITAASADLLPHIKASNNLVFGPKLCSLAYPDCVEISDNPAGYPDIYGNITGDPKFVSLSIPNLRLLLGSPGINAGVPINFITTDYDGNVRPQGSTYDIGAYEFTVVASPSPSLSPTSTPTPRPSPTPTPTPAPSPTPNPADINRIDGVNAVDLFLVLRNWLGIGSCDTFVCDLNSDNKINALDAALVVKNWGL